MTQSWFAPGRIEVFGKHTDYAGGRSLVCAVPRGITIRSAAAADGRITISDRATGETAVFSTTGEGPGEGWYRYPRTVIRRLSANFPRGEFAARIEIASDLPHAAGISSSSALIVGLAETLIARARLEEDDVWRQHVRTREDRASYFGCIENGASFGGLIGSGGVGTHGGSEDHAAIVLSTAGELRQFSFDPIILESVVRMPTGWTFVVATSGVAAHKTGDAQAAYNRLSSSAAAIADAWRREHPGDERSLGRLSRDGALQGWNPPSELRDRLAHFCAEDARVDRAARAFAAADLDTIAALAAASQHEADRWLGNQIDETRQLVRLAREIGATAASAFGAGWGGSVWALVQRATAGPFVDEWLRAYQLRYPRHASDGFVADPAAGARPLPTGDADVMLRP